MKTANEIFFYELAAMQDLEHQARSILGLLIGTRIQDSTLKRIIEDMADASERHSDRIDACLRDLGTAPLHTRSAPIRGVESDFQDFLRTPHNDAIRDLFALNAAQRITKLAIAGYEHLTDWATTIAAVTCTQCLLKNLVEKTETSQQLRKLNQTLSEQLLATTT
ncbi:ferritin-like domain-containing protein [Micromonospora sp. NPDC048930]|uniref:YciE/YciF ferroxidase family protein n=1 Tax=Micromonospora sp. NPDC048930 TaxID=3364261 RepID=UPI0037214294